MSDFERIVVVLPHFPSSCFLTLFPSSSKEDTLKFLRGWTSGFKNKNHKSHLKHFTFWKKRELNIFNGQINYMVGHKKEMRERGIPEYRLCHNRYILQLFRLAE